MVCGGGDIEQQSRFAHIHLLGQMQPEGAIAYRFSRAFKELRLRVSGDATLTVVEVAL